MYRSLAFLTAFGVLLGAGFVQGRLSDRWSTSPELEAALTRVPTVPTDFGPWKSRAVEGEAADFELAGAQAWWMRLYTDDRSGRSFLVILMCGRAGRMAVHTPEVCYRGAGFDMVGTPRPFSVRSELGDDLGTMWTARFLKNGEHGTGTRLYWGWSQGGPWQAPDNPRWRFRGEPYLYKLYVSHDVAGSDDGEDAARSFLRRLLPELPPASQAPTPPNEGKPAAAAPTVQDSQGPQPPRGRR